jgi:hypothetical protein
MNPGIIHRGFFKFKSMYELVFVFAVIVLVIFIFVCIALHLRRNGGSMTTTMFASTYEFLNKDKREAVEEIVNMNGNIKTEEETSGEPKKDSQYRVL